MISDIQLIKSADGIKLARIQKALGADYCQTLVSVKAKDCQRVINFLLAFMAFALPVSISLKAVFLVLASLSSFFYYRHDLLRVLLSPWFIVALLYFMVIVLGCLISPAEKQTQWDFIHKYSKLLYLPLLALGFQTKQSRFLAIHAYLLGVLVTVFCTFYKTLFWGLSGDAAATTFYNHILTGYFTAFAAFLAAVYASKTTGKRCLGYVLLSLVFSYHTLFMNPARTGYVMFAVLLLVILAVFFFKHAVLALLLSVSVLFLAYQSPVLHTGMRSMLTEARNHMQGQSQSSLGFRMQFHHYAQNLFLRSPLLGVGTGGFSHYFKLEQPVPSWGKTLMEPHGEYWLVAAEHGVLGLLAFALFLLSLTYELFHLQEMKIIFIGLFCTFLMGCFSDGFLLLTGPGYLFVIFAAMSFGESLSLNTTEPVLK